jgi:hypothetical protein
MKVARVLTVLLVVLVIVVSAYFFYNAYTKAQNLPRDVEQNQDLQIALNQALRLRWTELYISPLAFALCCFLFAWTRLIRLSVLRTLLSFALALMMVFVPSALLMERELQARAGQVALPMNAVLTAFFYPLAGVLIGFLVLFVTERWFEWNLARHAS